MKVLQVLGAIFGVILIAVLAAIGYLAHVGSGLDASSKAYVDEAIPVIVSHWSKDELLKRSSPQLLQIMNQKPEELDQFFRKLAGLGALKSYVGCKGDSNVYYGIGQGKSITATYAADATFEKGTAHFDVRLIQIDGRWQFLMFKVNSPIFFQ